MFNSLFLLLAPFAATPAVDLPTERYLNLAAIKTMVTAAEEEAKKRNVQVTLCIVDESGNLLFLERADGAQLNTVEFAQKKARHAALYKSPSKDGSEALKKGNLEVLEFPDFSRTKADCPSRWRAKRSAALPPAAPNPTLTRPLHKPASTLF
jgi:glc operon protein GlcG